MSSETVADRTAEEISLPRQPVPQCHPDRLAAVATLFGMQPQKVDRCRVLELGCGSGGNLIPMADCHRESTFVGIDGSELLIGIARHAADMLDLKNIDFRHLSMANVDAQPRSFDYLVCHDVFSSVAPNVQETILAICKSRLKPDGVAYISYDTFPGCLLPNLARQLARDITASGHPLAYRVAQARKLLGIFSESVADDDAPFGRLLKRTTNRALAQSDQDLATELLKEESHPLYFHQFVQRADAHGLRYLGDAEIGTMFAATFPRATEHNLLQVSNDVVSLEQHIDWLRNRAVRQTLLCHQDVALNHRLSPERLNGLFFAARLRPENATPDLQSAGVERFVTAAGPVISSAVPIVKAALVELAAAWPRTMSFGELAGAASRASTDQPDRDSPTPEQQDVLGQNLVQVLASGFVEAHGDADRFVTTLSPCPRASQMACRQALSSSSVTNRRHEAIMLDRTSQNLLPCLDGQHDRAALLRLLMAAVDRGQLSILMDSIPASGGESAGKILERTLDESLLRLAAYALLIA
jgi:methyltransferase-like protein/SAM-dependent methyltransferase